MKSVRLGVRTASFALFVLISLVAVSPGAAMGVAGQYVGTYSGSDSGTITIAINTNGVATCLFHSNVRGLDYFAYGSATSFRNGSRYVGSTQVPFQQTIVACATFTGCPPSLFCPALPPPAGYITLFGSNYSLLPASTLEGNWFASNGDVGAFTASYASGVGAADFINPAAFSGLWYDPKYTGSGFSITGTPQGLVAVYFGWDASGHRLWLTSSIDSDQIVLGQPITLDLMQTLSGTFATPAPPATNAHWGTMTLTFSTCTSATAILSGADGDLTESLTLLFGFYSLSC